MKKKEPTLEAVLEKMLEFGLDLDHIKVDLIKAGDSHQIYFFLDILNVLIDSIFQAKQKRVETSLKKKSLTEDISPESSGGEEISKILDDARKTYGRVQSMRKEADKENISEIKPQNFPAPRPSMAQVSSSDLDTVDDVRKYLPSKPKMTSKKKESIKETSVIRKTALNESEHEINVKIPTSDTTDVVLKVKPLNNEDLRSKRIHVRINKNLTPERPKSNKIVYGRKSLIGHHLRKTRPPMFSHKAATPKLDKKRLIQNVIDFTEQKKREEILNKEGPSELIRNPELEARLKCQKLIREKRTSAAQLRKLVKRIN